jgi:hypothetical protein
MVLSREPYNDEKKVKNGEHLLGFDPSAKTSTQCHGTANEQVLGRMSKMRFRGRKGSTTSSRFGRRRGSSLACCHGSSKEIKRRQKIADTLGSKL